MEAIPTRYLTLVCLFAGTLVAQGSLVRDFARTHAGLWKSPFEHPKQTIKIGAPLAAATAVLLTIDQPAINRYAQRPAPWAVKTSHAGDGEVLLGTSLLLYGVGRFTHNDTVSQMGSSSVAGVTHAYLITQVLKLATRRQRPDASNHWSMPSGHAMTSFAMAGAIASHPHAPRWLKIVAPAAAGAIAFSRVGARRHYPSDVAIGSTLGWLIGRAVRHR